MSNDNALTNDFNNALDAAAQKFNKDIVNYRTADAATRAIMDQMLTTLDTANLNSITSFGKEPTDVLRESSEAIVKRAQNATSFLSGFDKIKEQLANFNFETVGNLAKDYVKKMERKMAMASLSFKKSPVAYVFKKIGYAFGAKQKDATMENIRHEIDKSLLELADVVANLEESKAKIPQVVADLQTLENARLNAYSDYGVYLGVALEKYEQLKEEMPKLIQEAADSPMKQSELSKKRLALTVLNAKLTDMDTFHKSCLLQLKTIGDLEQALVMSQLKIDSHLTISQGQWMGLLAEASTAAGISEIAENVKAADDFGDKIFEQSRTMANLTLAMARNSFGHGTLDPVKVVEHLKQQTIQIQEDLKFVAEFNKGMEQRRRELDEAGQIFRAAATKVITPSEEVQKQIASPAAKDQNKNAL